MTRIENTTQSTTPAAAVARDPKLWDAAKQFEQVLVEQLTKQLQETAQPAGDEGEDGDDGKSAVSGFYSQLLPGALAQGVSDAGGLGLAQQLYDSMAQKGAK
jgi:Rod binding domain-containing protein